MSTGTEGVAARLRALRVRRQRLEDGERPTLEDVRRALQALALAQHHARQAATRTARAYERTALAHERVATVLDHLAATGVGDAEERRSAARRHRTSAAADRERASAERARIGSDTDPQPQAGEDTAVADGQTPDTATTPSRVPR